MTDSPVSTAVGLSSAEVADRVARGLSNDVPDPRSRSFRDIVRANTFTYFNFLIGSMWVLMLLCAPLIDSLFGLIIVWNSAIGIYQENRAARTLAKLSVVAAARPVVRRDGANVTVTSAELVVDDIVLLRLGDQLLVDGAIVASEGLEIDESLLTGEADPVDKRIGDEAMSGSFVVAGTGAMRAMKVGGSSYAAGLTAQAREFSLTKSELSESISKFVKLASYLLVPLGILLFISQYRANDGAIRAAVAGTVPGVVTMIPEGLVLLTSIAMAVSVVRLGRQHVLVQEMPAVEVLARVDVVCVDKTGTLTAPGMKLRQLVELDAGAPLGEILGAMGASAGDPNPTLDAIASAFAAPDGWSTQASVAFSSARKWSAATFAGRGWFVLGAPEMLIPEGDVVRVRADALAGGGARVLLLAASAGPVTAQETPSDLRPLALVVLDQKLREDAAETVRYFLDQGVTVKVISGDNAATVGAIAAEAGIPGAHNPVDARTMPEDPDELEDFVQSHQVFGRVAPGQKRAMVAALQRGGHVVAMTGDGVNDVLALKDADLGIAMGSGAAATRAVAQIVLLDDKFSVMPSVVAEGRRVLGNIERVSDLFLTKSFYAMVVSVVTLLATVPFPFLNRHLTLVTAFSIGIPAFFLALMPNTARFRPGFFRRVLVFAIPAGLICAVCAFASYAAVLHRDGAAIPQARAAAAITLFLVAWSVLLQVARPWNPLRLLICGAMFVGFFSVVLIPVLRRTFALEIGGGGLGSTAAAVGVAGGIAIWVLGVVIHRLREVPAGGPAPVPQEG